MSEKGIEIHTGLVAHRLVWGHPMKPQIKKHQDGPNKGQPVLKDGQPVKVWSFGIAIEKTHFQTHIWPQMAAEAATGYPNGVPQRFAWKFVDGDGIDSKGVPYNKREGYAGCYVLTISTEFKCPECWRDNGAGGFTQLREDEFKTGDYLACSLNLKVNVATGTNTPSMYVNPLAVQVVGQGTEIVSSGSVDPNTALGGRSVALPAGATPMGAAPPMAPPPGGMPGTTAMPQPAAMPGQIPGYPAPVGMPPAAAPMTPPPPPPAPVAGPQRPVDPSHIANAGTPHEQWWNGSAWVPAAHPAPAAPAVGMPPPAHDFVAAAGVTPAAMPGQMPGYPAPAGMPGQPAFPGAMPPR